MRREKFQFAIGVLVGIVLTALFFIYFAPRYQIVERDGVLHKQDRWTGDTWCFCDKEWKRVSEHDDNWKNIDDVLVQALKHSGVDEVRKTAMQKLKEKYPLLKKYSDEDILERVKLVYAREILSGLYLENFLKIERETSVDTSPKP